MRMGFLYVITNLIIFNVLSSTYKNCNIITNTKCIAYSILDVSFNIFDILFNFQLTHIKSNIHVKSGNNHFVNTCVVFSIQASREKFRYLITYAKIGCT